MAEDMKRGLEAGDTAGWMPCVIHQRDFPPVNPSRVFLQIRMHFAIKVYLDWRGLSCYK